MARAPSGTWGGSTSSAWPDRKDDRRTVANRGPWITSGARAGGGRLAEQGPPRRADGFRWWVIALGAALIPVNSLWIARAEALDYSGFPTCMSLFYNVVFTLVVLLLINAAIRRALPRAALRRQELIVVYAMTSTGSSLVGHDYLQMLVPTIPHVAYFATPENNWQNLITPHLPAWLTIAEKTDAVKAYELGHSSLYTWDHIQPFLVPMLCWSVFLLSVIGATLMMGVILRRQWVENEKLTYPIVQIPLMITEGGGQNKLFRSPLFWIGCGLAAGINVLNGLHQFFPALPWINVKVQDIGPLLGPYPPWNAVGWTPISFYPFAIGLSFFMPTNLAFSSWFFFLFRKAQQVVCASIGYTEVDGWFPYLREQSYGAWLALFGASLWLCRGYLAGLFRQIRTNPHADDGGITYRSAFIALGACTLVMGGFLAVAGLSPLFALAYVVLYLTFCGAAARVRAEVGPPSHEIGYIGTSYMMITALGTAAVGPKNLTIFSLLHFQNRMHRGLLMPQQTESLKAASEAGVKMKTMVIALSIAGVVGVISAFWALTFLAYGRTYAAASHPGAPGSAFAREHFNQLAQWLKGPVPGSQASINGILIGGAFALLLSRLSVAIHGFPFHPAGYALGMSFGLDYIWLPVMISWGLKTFILRAWGLTGYRKALPFFVGLVIGEFAVGGLWSFVRGVLGVQTYTFFIW